MTDETTDAATRDELEQLLETTRSDFHELVAGLSDADWRRKPRGQSWTNGQLCYHMALGVALISQTANRLREGKGVNPPAPLMPVMNLAADMFIRFRSRGATPNSVRDLYDESHKTALATLGQIGGDEWSNGARHLGEQRTVESSFRYMREHFEEHRETIQRSQR